jgi:UDP-sugar transporter A1/2/3
MDYLTFMKYFSLVLLVGQNTVLVLLMRYTRTQSGDMYAASTAVCVMEVGASCMQHAWR